MARIEHRPMRNGKFSTMKSNRTLHFSGFYSFSVLQSKRTRSDQTVFGSVNGPIRCSGWQTGSSFSFLIPSWGIDSSNVFLPTTEEQKPESLWHRERD